MERKETGKENGAPPIEISGYAYVTVEYKAQN